LLLRFLYFIILIQAAFLSRAQTLGGKAAYSFLQLPASPLLSASGGVNVSYANNDIGLATNNPALLNSQLHSQVGTSFNAFYAGIKSYQLAGAYHHTKWDATLGSSLFYVDYGNLLQTDEGGTTLGEFRPRDMVFQLSGSKTYLEKWQYGLSAKFIHSTYGSYQSSALAFDVGLHYSDSALGLQAGLLAKNMGVQLSTYYGVEEELPFDLQIGITKRLAKAPLGFSLTAQQAHQFAIGYHDSLLTGNEKPSFINKLFNHVVLASHIYLGKNIEATIGYNRLRRSELNIGTSGNGINGFSAGFKASFSKLQFQYARAYFQRASAYNQLGINLKLNALFGTGMSH
jgi:hypothetical protein